MRVVIAPDSFGGVLSARAAAEAIAEGWRRKRPADDLTLVPLSDGGRGLLDVVAPGAACRTAEVVGPMPTPVEARFVVRDDGVAIIESAEACGLHLLAPAQRKPLSTTTYGVGQLLDAARSAGARRIVVGAGGSATVDGGAGALLGLGFHLRRANGYGLKVGGGELIEVAGAEARWVHPGWHEVEVEVWADVRTPLELAATIYGPQKGADDKEVGILERALRRWAEVAERDLHTDGAPGPHSPYTGAAGGLAFGLGVGLGAALVPGAEAVAAHVGLDRALEGAAAVVTGEGRVDSTSLEGKVVGHLIDRASEAGIRVLAVAGVDTGVAGLDDVEEASPQGPGDDPGGEVTAAAARLAARADL